MLGLDQTERVADERLIDALKEIVNIIVGNFLTDMYGTGVTATLGLPTLTPPPALAKDYGDPNALWLSVEGDPVLCIMRIGQASDPTGSEGESVR
jgi:chemotaxis protein CheY-P-specific phosphatase CheC